MRVARLPNLFHFLRQGTGHVQAFLGQHSEAGAEPLVIDLHLPRMLVLAELPLPLGKRMVGVPFGPHVRGPGVVGVDVVVGRLAHGGPLFQVGLLIKHEVRAVVDVVGGDIVVDHQVVQHAAVLQGVILAAGHRDDAADVVLGQRVVHNPGVLRAGDLNSPAVIAVGEVAGDDRAAVVDLVEDAAAVVVVDDVVEDADVAVVGVEPDAAGVDVIGHFAAADDGPLIAGDVLHAGGHAPVAAEMAVIVCHHHAVLDSAVLGAAHAHAGAAVVGEVAVADDAVLRAAQAEAVEVGEVDFAVFHHHPLALAEADHGPLPARLAIVPHLQAADDHVVDFRCVQDGVAHADLDGVPAGLAADVQVEGLILGIEEERLVNHVADAFAHRTDHLEIGRIVDSVPAGQLQRIVVVDEHLRQPAPRLIGEEARIVRVGEELLAQVNLPKTPGVQGIGFLQAFRRGDPDPGAADQL